MSNDDKVNINLLREQLQRAQAELAALRAGMDKLYEGLRKEETDNAALQADRDRLDWLIETLNIRYPYYKSGDLNEARAAIDAARKGGAK